MGNDNPLEELEEDIEENTPGFVDSFVQRQSYGLFGTDDNGNIDFREGASTRAADEFVGEITGRNQMREAFNRQTARIRQEEAKREDLLEDERRQRQREDINASRAAGRRRRAGSGGGSGGQSFSLGEQRDFLGL